MALDVGGNGADILGLIAGARDTELVDIDVEAGPVADANTSADPDAGADAASNHGGDRHALGGIAEERHFDPLGVVQIGDEAEATALAHGVAEAEQAREASRALFAGHGHNVSADDESLPTTEIAAAELTDGFTLADAFVAADLAKSRGEARRLAQQGGLSVDDARVSDVDAPFSAILGARTAVLLRAGKKRFKRVVLG